MWNLLKQLILEGDTHQDGDVSSNWDDFDSRPSINPATGLPMAGAVDTEGNPYGAGSLGTDSTHDADLGSTDSSSLFDDDLHNSAGGSSAFDDDFGGMGGIGGSGMFDD